jgi:hypothetical protein
METGMTATHLLDRSGPFLETDEYQQLSSSLTWWQAVDKPLFRAYWHQETAPTTEATSLQSLIYLKGASYQTAGNFHYVVETDVLPAHEEELNAWYNTEHLLGLSHVPGVISASRYLRLQGGPRYIACYELESPVILECKEWLAIRHTAWSSRVRPLFLNTIRQHFIRIPPSVR